MDHFLLLQVRDADDPMRRQEVNCFARALNVDAGKIEVHDLLSGPPSVEELDRVDVVLLGGSGDYSVAQGGPWLEPALDAMKELVELNKPTFASCWGFQAMAKALGGEVVTDLQRAELGAVAVRLTDRGKLDPLFAPLGETFLAPMGHQDCVTRLPDGVTLLASSEKVRNQAFRVDGKPIYCTQFHPELNRRELIQRVKAYPRYVEKISGKSIQDFCRDCVETDATNQLLGRFAQMIQSGDIHTDADSTIEG
ncbi:MAG: type 1 glutamine amidotransferase, partial [Pirellulaceae bacterium]|nr:type 1 glutamine amidotransferase [Pirellulaceae bacterium]